MAELAPIGEKDITATYYGFAHYIELKAAGKISKIYTTVSTPFFEKDELWYGGLRFTLNTFVGPVDAAVMVDYEAEPLRVPITLPERHFNSEHIAVETAYGTFQIKINYHDFPAIIPDPDVPQDKNTKKQILPVIDKALPVSRTITVTTEIPPFSTTMNKPWVRPSFNKRFLKLVNCHSVDNKFSWTFAWNELPLPKHDPQPLNVIVETWNNTLGSGAEWIITVQPYHIFEVIIVEKEPERKEA